ncbi:preprotein translocase subunit YajC [Elioraea tepidiphila]|uniref:preprotein translocase subunit YajC n=1 Tax=Elioraea tepidiphila TaxID=457934 RepID=UPI00036605A2|nr:preprotein translocase subunit YajC [Elioraea tepidiphila]
MLISPAYAQAGDPTGGLMSLAPLILIFIVFYFILIRPQQRKAKEHREMLAALQRGDRVVTGGGVFGTVIRVTPESDEVIVEISKNPQLRVTVLKSTIQSVLREPTEAPKPEEAEQQQRQGKRRKGRPEGEAAAEGQAETAPADQAEPRPEPGPANDQAPPPRQG